MVKTLLGQVKQYKKASLLTPLFTALEVVMEVLVPWVTSSSSTGALRLETYSRFIFTEGSW